MKTTRMSTLVGVITTIAVAGSLLTASPATAQTAATASVATTVDSTGFAVPHPSIPVVDSQVGVGAQAAPEPARIDVVRDDSSPRSALVRITAFEADAATDVYAEGSTALRLEAGSTASTTVLVPLDADGTFALSASAAIDTRIEPVAYFGDETAPGSVQALAAPTERTEDGGTPLSTAGAVVGLTGLGGVPSTGVRSVFVTASFDAAADADSIRTVTLDGVEIPVAPGDVISTLVTPTVDGNTVITGPADLNVTLTVRGWVAESAQSADAVPANVTGSIVPAIGAETIDAELTDTTPVEIPRGELATDDHVLALVWADAASTVTAIAAGTAASGRTTGAVVDGDLGAAPQLLLLDPADLALSTVRGDIDAHSRVVAGLVGADLPAASDLAVTVTSPTSGSTADLGELGGTVELTGQVTVTGGDLASIEIAEGDNRLGAPDVRYDSTGITWSFRTAAPETGTYDFTITAIDRSGARATATVTLTIVLPPVSETVIVENVQILDDPTTLAVTALTDDTVVVVCDLEVGPGDYLVASAIPGAPEGFLRRILAVDITDAGTVLHTEPALLTDVIIQANADEERYLGEGGGTVVEEAPADPEMDTLEGDLPTAWTSEGTIDTSGFTELTEDTAAAREETDDEADAAGASFSTGEAPTVRYAALSGGVESGVEASYSSKLGLKLDKSLGKTEDASKTDGESTKRKQKAELGFYIESSGSVSVKLGIDAEVWVTWSWLIPTPHINFQTAFTQSTKTKTTVAAYLKASASSKTNAFEKKVASYHFPGFAVYLGIPVWVVPKASLDVTGEVTATASVEYTIEQSATKKIGVKCNDGHCEKIDETPKGADGSSDLNATKEVFSGGGTLDAKIGPEVSASALLYGVAGPEFSLAFRLGGKASITGSSDGPKISGSIEIYLEVSAGLKLTVEIPIFDIKVIDWTLGAKIVRKFTLKLWKFEKELGAPEPPPADDSGSSGTKPTPGSGGEGDSGSSGTKPTPGSGGEGDGTRDSIDVMFVIDTTGSMWPYIRATVDNARSIASRLSATARSARIGLVEYRDYGDSFMARTVQPLTEDLSTFGAALDTLYASGGGDWEEAVYSGIVTALAEDWRPSAARSIIVMGDAPAHDPDKHTGYTASQVAGFLSGAQAICRNGDGDIIGGPVLPACAPSTGASFSAGSMARTRIVPTEKVAAGLPVILFGISSTYSLSDQLRPLAEATGGTVADIDGASAVGDAIDAALEVAGAAPQAYFEWAPGDENLSVAFDGVGTVFEGENATFSFDFGDGSDAATGAAAASHTYAEAGTYEVTLTVTDEQGRIGQVTADVTVTDGATPEWSTLIAAPDRDSAQAGELVTFTADGLTPGGRVSVAWDGVPGAATGVVGDDGVVMISLAVPADAVAGELGYTVTAADEYRTGSGALTVAPTLAVCAA